MLARVTAIEYVRQTTSGKTGPFIITARRADNSTVEVVAKFSAGCEESEKSLAREAIAACLALDLGLPIPEPFLVDVPPAWADAVPDPGQRAKIKKSSPVAFGLRFITGYSAWDEGRLIDSVLLPTAAAVFVFDLLIQNSDRRTGNPNCLVKGSEILIFDHELAFMHRLVIGWKPPWVLDGLEDFSRPGKHIFRQGLLNRNIDFKVIRASWISLPDAQLAKYEAGLPAEWSAAAPAVESALALVRGARDNIDACLEEVKRVLT
jgi:hypothetical protein